MTETSESAAIRKGREMARGPFGAKAAAPRSRPVKNLALAIGDSWFRYWPRGDILDVLENRLEITIARNAREGCKLSEMLYGSDRSLKDDATAELPGLGKQVSWLLDEIRHLDKADAERVAAILISGGGNDVAGDELVLGALVRPAAAGATPPRLDAGQVRMLVDGRLRGLYETLLGCIDEAWATRFGGSPRRPSILLHGYSYPVPDGRGVLGKAWLNPVFKKLGYGRLADATPIMQALIDRLNEMQIRLVRECGLPDIRHVDVRSALKNDLEGGAYKAFWQNELHPTIPTGFERVADVFEPALRDLMLGPDAPAAAPDPGARPSTNGRTSPKRPPAVPAPAAGASRRT